MKRIIGMVAILALLSTACAPTPTPTPTTPSPSTSASSAPTESMGAAEPRVVCETPDETQITLTCEAGVAAARAVVGADPAVAAIEYYLGWGPLCPPGAFCALLPSNTGHVLFRRTGGLPDIVVRVTADLAGKVTAFAPTSLLSPSPS